MNLQILRPLQKWPGLPQKVDTSLTHRWARQDHGYSVDFELILHD